MSGQGGSDGAPRAGRGRSGARGRGGAASYRVPRDGAPRAQAQPGGRRAVIHFPSSTVPGSAAYTSGCSHLPARKKEPRGGTGANADVQPRPQPGGSEGAAFGTRAGQAGRETKKPGLLWQGRSHIPSRMAEPRPPGRSERKLAAPCPGKSEENQQTEGGKDFPSGASEEPGEQAPGPADRRSNLEHAEPAGARAPQRSGCSPSPSSPAACGPPALPSHCATDLPCASNRRPGSQTREAAEHNSKLRLGSPEPRPLSSFAPSSNAGALTPGEESGAASRTRTGG